MMRALEISDAGDKGAERLTKSELWLFLVQASTSVTKYYVESQPKKGVRLNTNLRVHTLRPF